MEDKSWLKNIYLEYQNLVYSIAVSVIKDPQLAEDIVQEVFVTLYYKGDSIRDKSKIKPWLIRTAVNRAIDFARRFQKVVSLPGDYLERLESSVPFEPSGEIDEKELALELRSAVNMLPADFKALVILYYYLEIPQKEIAETLGIPLGTVKTRLRRARLALKYHLLRQEMEDSASEKGVLRFE
jgi:RNA polymerase sigma-70 factor (ECF subfamily)